MLISSDAVQRGQRSRRAVSWGAVSRRAVLGVLCCGLHACGTDDPILFPGGLGLGGETGTGSVRPRGGAGGADGTLGNPAGGSVGAAPSVVGGAGGATGGQAGNGAGSSGAGGSGVVAGGTGGATPDGGGAIIDEPPPCGDPCPCSVGPFGAPELITGLEVSGPTLGPRLSGDALTLYFSAIDGDENILSATRPARGSAFSSAVLVPNLDDDGSEEGTPFPAFDGLSLYFFSTRADLLAPGERDIWLSSRESAAAPFSEPVVLPAINTPGLEHLPWLSQDELTLMFVSSRTSPNLGSNIWSAQRETRADEFGEPVELAGINTNVREDGFSLSADGLTLYFASNRVEDVADMDIFVATRPNLESAFGAAEPVSVLNSAAPELDPSLSADGFELLFASQREGTFQLYRALRDCSALD